MNFKFFSKLPDEARFIREKVFVEEQGFENEFDEIDDEAIHIVFYKNNNPIATGRAYKGEEENEYIIGRIAVLKSERKNHIGEHIISELENKIKEQGGIKVSLSAQCRVQGFYEKQGYKAVGEIYLDEYCEHIHMEKVLL